MQPPIHCAHAEAENETGLAGLLDGAVQHVQVDRTFVDEAGRRWIIDYKIARPPDGADVEAFLDEQAEYYAPQLGRYAALWSALDARPVSIGLYFPLVMGWREWRFEATRAMSAD